MAKDDGKGVAIISYITIIGWIIALVMNNQNKTKLGSFHIRQTLLLHIFMTIAFKILFGWIISVILFVFLVIGFIGAINGEQKEVPIIGAWAQDWFKSL